MILLGVEFGDQLFTNGELVGIQAEIMQSQKTLADMGISYHYDLKAGDAIIKHTFETVLDKEYVPTGSVAFSGLFFNATGCPEHTLSKNDVIGKSIGIIVDSSRSPSIIGFCTVADLATLPTPD